MIGRITPRKLNVDTDERSLSSDEMKNALNLAVSADAEGDGGVVKFSDGNLSISPSDPLSGMNAGENTVVGSVTDEELGVVYFFVHNAQGNHGIYAYSEKTNTYRKIFSDPSLDFDKNGFVKGDVVRVKRNPDIVAPDVVVGQGDEGGVVDIFPEGFSFEEIFTNEDGIPADFVMPMTDFTVQLITKIDDIQYLDEEIVDYESFITKYGDPSNYEVSLNASLSGRVRVIDEQSFVSTSSETNTPPFEGGDGRVLENHPYTIYKTGEDFFSQDHTPTTFVDENQENSIRFYEGGVYLISKVNFSYPQFFYFTGTIYTASPNPDDTPGYVDGEGTEFTTWTYDQAISWSFYNMTSIALDCTVKHNGSVLFSKHPTAPEDEVISISETNRKIHLTKGGNGNYKWGYYQVDSEYNPFIAGVNTTEWISTPMAHTRRYGYIERFPDDEYFDLDTSMSFEVYNLTTPFDGVLGGLPAVPGDSNLKIYSLIGSSLDLSSTSLVYSSPLRYTYQHDFLNSKRVVPGTEDIESLSLGDTYFKDVSAIVKIKIDVSNSPTYQEAVSLAEVISNGTTSPENWPTEVPDAVFRSSTDDPPVEIFFQTRCASQTSVRLFGSNIAIPRYNLDGSPKSWSEIQSEALVLANSSSPSFYGVESGGIANSDLNNSNNYYNNLNSIISSAEQALGVSYFTGSEYNFIVIDFSGAPSALIPELDDCPPIPIGEIFKPTLYYFGVDGDSSKYQEYTPINRLELTNTIQEVISDLQDPVYEFLVNIPISAPIDQDNNDGILHLRNNSSVPNWSFQELVSQEDYDISLYTYEGEDYVPESLKEEMLSLSNELTVNYSFDGGPNQIHNISGRRVRVPLRTDVKNGINSLSFDMPSDVFQYILDNSAFPWQNEVQSNDFTPSSGIEDPFCFGSSTSCGESLRVLPEVIQTSDTSVNDPIDTTVDANGEDSTTDPIRVTETESERPVQQSRLTPEPLATKTKKTIKKKY